MSSKQGQELRVNVATALNSRYMRYTYVMLTSLFDSHTRERVEEKVQFHVYLLHSDLTGKDQECLSSLAEEYGHTIHFIKVDREAFPVQLPTTQSWSLETYFRLMLMDILPADVDRLLYVDVDMIIQKPILELYCMDLEGAYFCACPDMTVQFPTSDVRDEVFREHIAAGFTYFNAGLMLWDIASLRGRYCFQDYMDLAEKLEYRLLAPDQDLLNYMHWNQVKYADPYRYDLFSKKAYGLGYRYEQVKAEVVIVHFAGMKPWEGRYVHYDVEKLWWDYAGMTPFYHELMEEFLQDCLGDSLVYDTISALSAEKKDLLGELQKSTALCRRLAQLLASNAD